MSLPEISKLKIKHEAIMDYMLCNPTCTYADVSIAFGVTVPWISCIVNSDVFQQLLRVRRDEMFEAGVLAPLESRMKAVAELALDRLAEKVQVGESIADLTNTADKILGRLGYGTGSGNGNNGGGQTNYIFGPALVQRAQQFIGRSEVNGSGHQVARRIEDLADYSPSPILDEAISQGSESRGHPLRAESAPLDGVEV